MNKKRLVGGEFLLDLSMMSFVASVDAETFTAISNAEVLSQLTDLKTYVKNQKSIKPIWVKMKDSESYFVARGELQKVINQPNFVLVIKAKDKILTIQVEFTQVLNEDDVPMDDWYIDTGDAGYNFIDSNYYVDVNAVRKIPAPESTTLTDEEIELISNGVFIEGTFLTAKNPVFFPASIFSDDYYGLVITQSGDYGNTRITHYKINHTTKVITIYDGTGMTLGYNGIVSGFNGKSVPTYPANDVDKYLKCEQGILKWDDINLADIVDNDGNKRFIEGDLTFSSVSGLSKIYGKWSLSGTHLLIVIVGKLDADAGLTSGDELATTILPEFIYNKLRGIGTTNRLDSKTTIYSKEDLSVSQSATTYLYKSSTLGKITLATATLSSQSYDREFRQTFDLLIDTESQA